MYIKPENLVGSMFFLARYKSDVARLKWVRVSATRIIGPGSDRESSLACSASLVQLALDLLNPFFTKSFCFAR
jgi:hypothetical protein